MNLSLAEELILLALDDDSGKISPSNKIGFDIALAGSLLADLSLRNRLDSDLNKMWLASEELTDVPALDLILGQFIEVQRDEPIRTWIHRAYLHIDFIINSSTESLIDKGILRQVDEKYLWFFNKRCYPPVDGKAEMEVKHRLFNVLFEDAIPEPRDIALVSLCNAGGLFTDLLSARELRKSEKRIWQLSRLDLITHEIGAIIADMYTHMAIYPV